MIKYNDLFKLLSKRQSGLSEKPYSKGDLELEELIFDVDLSAFAQKIISPDSKKRIEAIDSVRDLSNKSIKAREVLSMLISALEIEQDPLIISRLTKIVGKIGDSTVTPFLKKFLWHPDLRVVANTLEGLGYIYSLDIIPIILPFLSSPDNRIKANAARSLYGLNPTLALEKLNEMINSDDVFIRDSATYILSSISDTRCQEMLVEILMKENDMGILKKVISALCNKGDDSTVDKLEKMRQIKSDQSQQKIIEDIVESINTRLKVQLASIQNINNINDLAKLMEIYNNGTNKEKEQVCSRLFEIGDESSLPFLKRAANDDDTSIRYAAKKAINNIFGKISRKNQGLGFSSGPAAARTQAAPLSSRDIARNARSGSDKAKKEEVIDFSDIIGKKEVPPAGEEAGKSKSGLNKPAPAYIDEIDIAFLVLDLNNDNPVKRAEAVSKLLYADKNTKGVKEAVKYLVERLYVETEPQVKSQTLRVIGTLGTKSEIPVLKKFLEDEANDYRIRANALEGLGCIDEAEVFDIIIPYLSHNDNRIKANAVIAAWKRNPDSTYNIIAEMIRSQNVAMRDSAAYGLLILKSHDKKLINLMMELFIRETVPDIILKLTQGLSVLGDEQILKDMEKMLPNASALKKGHIETIILKIRQKIESLKNLNAQEVARDSGNGVSDFDAQFKLYDDEQKRLEVIKSKQADEERMLRAGNAAAPEGSHKIIELDDGSKIPLKSVEAHLFEINHPDEKVRLNAIYAITYYLKTGLNSEYFNQVEMLLTLSLNDASLKIRKEAFEAYQLIQTKKAIIIKVKKQIPESEA